MRIRHATADNRAAISRVARDSFEASYSLSPRAIDGAVSEWYGEKGFAATLADDDALLVVAEEEGEVRGFAEGVLVTEGGDGDLLWLHVDPAHRGDGYGSALFAEIHETLLGMDAGRLRAKVLEDNAEGNEFYVEHGFEMVDTDEVEIDDDPYIENIYVRAGTEEPIVESASTAPPSRVETPDGRETHVDPEEVERGSKGPFYTAYADADRTDKFGYFCANCESLDNAMDTMGRVKCNACGNLRKATRWDATAG